MDQDKKYEQDLTEYMHLQIEERMQPDSELEKTVLPESVREGKFWKWFHTKRKIIVSRSSAFIRDWRKMVVVWAVLGILIVIGIHFGWDREVIGGTVFVFGLVSSAFAWLAAGLLSLIGLIPFVGPIIVTALSSSLLWIINALGYFVSVLAIKSGHGKAVLNYRLLVIVFLIGLVVGYVFARIIH